MSEGRDWTGNSVSAFSNLGASNHSAGERQCHDFYATHPSAIDGLLEKETLPETIWEPACGSGCLSKRLEQSGHKVISTDLYDQGYGTSGVDFLRTGKMPDGCKCILTNPPFRYAMEFAMHGLDILPHNGIMFLFLRLQFLEGKQRYDGIYRNNPPRSVHVFSSRMTCAMNADFQNMSGSAQSYAWYVWKKGYKGGTAVDWLKTSIRRTGKTIRANSAKSDGEPLLFN